MKFVRFLASFIVLLLFALFLSSGINEWSSDKGAAFFLFSLAGLTFILLVVVLPVLASGDNKND